MFEAKIALLHVYVTVFDANCAICVTDGSVLDAKIVLLHAYTAVLEEKNAEFDAHCVEAGRLQSVLDVQFAVLEA